MKLLKSRTFWTLIGMFAFNGLEAVQDGVPANWQVGVNAVLTILGAFFKVNPSQSYGK